MASPEALSAGSLLDGAEKLLASDAAGALAAAQRARDLAEAASDLSQLAGALRVQAHAKRSLDRHAEAIEDYAESRRLFLRAGERHEAARTLIGRIDAFMYLDRLDEARRTGRQALRELRDLRDDVRVGRVLTNLGNLEHRRDRPVRALRLYEEARAILHGAALPLDVALVDYNAGNILVQLGRLEEAEAKFRFAHRAAGHAGNRVMAAFASFSLAELDVARARYPAALRRFEECEREFAELGHSRGRCNCLLDRAEVYQKLSLDVESMQVAEEAERGFLDLGLVMEATRARFFRGIAEMRSGDRTAGRARVRHAERSFRKLGNELQAAAAGLRRVQSERIRTARTRERSVRTLERAAARFRRHGLEDLRAEAGLELTRLSLQAGRWRSATVRLRALRRSIHPRDRPDLEARACGLQALAEEQRGKGAAAVRAAEASLAALEGLRDRLGAAELPDAQLPGFRRLHRDLARILCDGLADRPIPLLALLARLERTRQVDRRRAQPKAEDSRIEEIRSRLAALTSAEKGPLPSAGFAAGAPRLAERRQAERALQERIRRARLAGSVRAGERHEAIDVDGTRERLGRNDIWLHFVDRGREIGGLAVTRRAVVPLARLLSKKALHDGLLRMNYHAEVIRVDEAAGGRRTAALRRSAEQTLARLSATCLAPFEAELESAERVLVRPAGGLDSVPWGALPLGEGILWDRAVVSLVPDAFGRAPVAETALERDIQIWSFDPSDLPHVAEETEGVRAALGAGRVISGADATREAFLAGAAHASLLHFAGHGTFRRDNPLFSSLRFSDRDVTFLDLEELDLCAKLVVLSACRTGRSAGDPELGMGLSRGFLQAGAAHLLVSLWRIGDEAACRFMQGFYQELVSGLQPEEALRRAALLQRDEGRHPADWGGFQLAARGI